MQYILKGRKINDLGGRGIENKKLGGPSPGILRLLDSFDAKVNGKKPSTFPPFVLAPKVSTSSSLF